MVARGTGRGRERGVESREGRDLKREEERSTEEQRQHRPTGGAQTGDWGFSYPKRRKGKRRGGKEGMKGKEGRAEERRNGE